MGIKYKQVFMEHKHRKPSLSGPLNIQVITNNKLCNPFNNC